MGFIQTYALGQTKSAMSMTTVEPFEIQFGLGFTDDWLPLNDNVMGGQSLTYELGGGCYALARKHIIGQQRWFCIGEEPLGQI